MSDKTRRLRRILLLLSVLLGAYALGEVIWLSVVLSSAHRFAQLAGDDVIVLPALALSCACAGLVHSVMATGAAAQKRYCTSLVLAVCGGLALVLALLAVAAAASIEQLSHLTDVAQALTASRAEYETAPAHWDRMQRERACCGVASATDWGSVIPSVRGLPMSCCAQLDGQAGMSVCFLTSVNRHKDACAQSLGDELRAHFELASFVSIGQLVLQVASVGFLSFVTHRQRNEW